MSTAKVAEAARISDQLRRAFEGDAWHGPALLELLEDVDARAAAARPIPDVHSIWELVLHIEAWDGAAIKRLSGKKAQLKGKQNFPSVPAPTEAAWREAVAHAKRTHEILVKTVAGVSEARLRERCPGKKYDFYHLLHGVAQHELYHAGQIAILKKARIGKRAKRAIYSPAKSAGDSRDSPRSFARQKASRSG